MFARSIVAMIVAEVPAQAAEQPKGGHGRTTHEPKGRSGTAIATDKAAKEAEAAAAKAQDLQEKWDGEAKEFVTKLFGEKEKAHKAEEAQRDLLLSIAKRLYEPKASINDKGFTPNAYAFRAAMIKHMEAKRNTTAKADNYIRRVVSQFDAVILAVQHGNGVTVSLTTDEKGNPKHEKVENALQFLQHQATSLAKLEATARAIKRESPQFKTEGNGTPEAPPRVQAGPVETLTGKWKARHLSWKAYVNMLDFMRAEATVLENVPKNARPAIRQKLQEVIDMVKEATMQQQGDTDADEGTKSTNIAAFKRKAG